jgi:excisionase family DNA binding protein
MTAHPPAVDSGTDANAADICTVDEVAVWLGVNRKTLYLAAQRREIPCGRLGRRIVMSRAQITAWLAGRFP